MKKMAGLIICGLFISTLAYSAPVQQEEDYKDLEQLSAKVIKMKKVMDKFVKDVTASYAEEGTRVSGDVGGDIKVDVIDGGKFMVVKADLPGMEKDKIDIILESGKLLKISGSREIVINQAAPGVLKQERSIGKFERLLELPAEGISEGIKAVYKDGVLEITIPKRELPKAEKVKIKVL